MRFEFASAGRIVFGHGTIAEAGPIAASLGSKVFVVAGVPEEFAQPLFDALQKQSLAYEVFYVEGEPKTTTVLEGVTIARAAACDVVIGYGGGSGIDTAKAIAALLTNPGEPLDYLEVIGKGQPITQQPAPFIAIPTTAGTGAEVTRNAVLLSPEHQVKVSLRSAMMLADVALVDPELTLGVPKPVTASTGMDALTQVIEPYVSHLANPLTDGLCREGIQRAARSLLRAYEHGDDLDARTDMSITSLLSGLALANAKLGAVHGFAGPVGGMYGMPHGVVCAALMPHATTVNVRALQERDPENAALARYDEVARLLTGNPKATADDGVKWLQEMGQALHLPPLAEYGLKEADFPILVEKSAKASSMKGNPITLTSEELTAILQAAL